ASHPDRQSRTRRHLSRPQDHCPTRPRDRQPIRNAHRGDLRQASFRQILDQDLRQIRPRSAPGDHHQRGLGFQALPQEPAPAKAGVEHRQGPATRALAPVRKTIYSLRDLREILLGCNRRYLEYLSSLDDFSAGIRALDRLTQPRPVNGRNLKGLNFFTRANKTLLSRLHAPASTPPALPPPAPRPPSPHAPPPPPPRNPPPLAPPAASNPSPAPI